VNTIKIKVEKWTFDGSVSYKIVGIENCCNDIRQNPLIDFQADCFENSEDKYGVALCESETYTEPYENYETTDYRYYKINRCPFCGDPISIEVVCELDKTDEYKRLKDEVYGLRKKINKCDSKKKERALESEFREKDNLLNSYYRNDSIKIDIE